jgi:hypothetical protein
VAYLQAMPASQSTKHASKLPTYIQLPGLNRWKIEGLSDSKL